MINIEELFEQKKQLPDWLVTHPIFKDIKSVKKIFPSIGLNNFSFDIKANLLEDSYVLKDLLSNMENALYNVGDYPQILSSKDIVKLLANFRSQLRSKIIINNFKKTQKLVIYKSIDNDTLSFKEGEGLFRAYGKLREFLNKHYGIGIAKLEDFNEFKEFSSLNVNELTVKFSADGLDGAWDLLTMSMRGIASCQSWTGQYSKSLIGSLIDPYVGIIYLTTSNKMEHGTQMVRRCLVRFIVNSFYKKPVIYIDRMYPQQHDGTLKIFKDALQKATNNKFDIIDTLKPSHKYFIPYSSSYESLLKHSPNPGYGAYVNMNGNHNYYSIFSYRDNFIEFKLKNLLNTSNTELVDFQNLHITTFHKSINELKEPISHFYLQKILEYTKKYVLNIEVYPNNVEYSSFIRKMLFNYFVNIKTLSNQIIKEIEATLKSNKDKTIFIPHSKSSFNDFSDVGDYLRKHILPILENQLRVDFKSRIKSYSKVKTAKK